MKFRGITKIKQVERVFKSSAFYAWNSADLLLNIGLMGSASTSSLLSPKIKGIRSRRRKLLSSNSTSDSDQGPLSNRIDNHADYNVEYRQ